MNTNAALTWGRSDWGALKPGELLSEAGIDSYRSQLRAIVRGLWGGSIDIQDFVLRMTTSLDRSIKAAWKEGAARAGVTEDEFTDDEKYERERFYWAQVGHIASFGTDAEKGSKANGGKLAPLLSRVELWVNQYNSVAVKAEAMAAGDAKYMWVYGPTEHCSSCAGLNGKVKRMSYWVEHVLPQNAPNPRLSCGGWRCKCTLQKTTEPLSKGRLPGV